MSITKLSEDNREKMDEQPEVAMNIPSLRLAPHACDCCTLESALGLTECERSVKWL